MSVGFAFVKDTEMKRIDVKVENKEDDLETWDQCRSIQGSKCLFLLS